MNNLGVEIGGNFVSFAELRSDVQACYRKGMSSNFCFLPETVEALLDYIAAQQSVQLTALRRWLAFVISLLVVLILVVIYYGGGR